MNSRPRVSPRFDAPLHAVSSNITIVEHYINSFDDAVARVISILTNSDNIMSVMQPWKVEIGLTLTTDKLGLLHGLRFFTNCLPTFIDPFLDTPIYTTGITMFL